MTVTVTESPTNDLPTAGDDVATVVEDSVDNVIRCWATTPTRTPSTS